jgi:hypothetical protein
MTTRMEARNMKNIGAQVPIQEVIWANIKDLPKESISEILDFIVFVRTKTFHPEVLEQPAGRGLFHRDLSTLDETETAHLEHEFADYQALYPHE